LSYIIIQNSKIMKETLHVKNFGPIIDAEIFIKDINIFIGTTSSGKSTLAKLISIFKSGALDDSSYISKSAIDFYLLLASYNIDFNVVDETYIKYTGENFYYEFKDRQLFKSHGSLAATDKLNAIYIPAERVFFSTFSQSIFGLINNNISLPKWLIDFGAKYEQARNGIRALNIEFLKVQYQLVDGIDTLNMGNNKVIKLSQASSGVQSAIPLLLVMEYFTNPSLQSHDLFVIEEPEMNLYPSAQKDLLELIINNVSFSKDKLIITSHSPYLLTTLDNLIQAKNAQESNKEISQKVSKLVPQRFWVDFENVACYYFDKGTVRSTLDYETKSIGPSNIDDVSIELSETFEKLLALKYGFHE
jgi:predicted ATPase